MNFMYGEKAARELRDREIREETRVCVNSYLDSLDEDDRRAAQFELQEMFALQRPSAFQPFRSSRRSFFDQQQQTSMMGILGLGGLV